MGKTRIEWCDYSINPVKGLCPMACSYCYARRMYKRYHWDETIKFYPNVIEEPYNRKPAKWFVGSTMELFGDWIDRSWMERIIDRVKGYPQHTFIFLTKQPQNLIKWSPFPDNAWVGVSATSMHMAFVAKENLAKIEAPVKFLSFEPLQGQIDLTAKEYTDAGIGWIILGQQTPLNRKTQPKIEWINEIVESADKAKIPVFLKENLNKMFAQNNCELFTKYKDKLFIFKQFDSEWSTRWHIRQQFPKV